MGLNTTHDAFHGAYSAFNRFRQEVVRAMGGSYPPHNDRTLDDRWVYYDSAQYNHETHPGLFEFIEHSDCEGEISPEMCVKVADDLEALLPKIEALGSETHGHLARFAGFADVTRRFIAGCRAAAAAGEPLEFR